MHLSDFDYELPNGQIAQAPASRREASRLMRITRDGVEHLGFYQFPDLLRPGDLLVLNDTRVIKARLHGVKDSGGQAEVLVERIDGESEALCQVRVSKALKPGRFIQTGNAELEVLGREGDFYRLRFPSDVLAFLEERGETPLPPYIQRAAETVDVERYQTVYGRQPGAVAAPTAGLHFTDELLRQIRDRGVEITEVTLHVGAGTFQPVRVEDVSRHRMHAERYEIGSRAARALADCRARGGRVVAVGTTVVRTLESAARVSGEVDAGSGETDLFITPGFQFRVVDALLTNFHLPQSTLLMLVCAFAGYERVMAAYAEAVNGGYRFFSYGDACFMERMDEL
jgi:S-adenosylmethionine:tRNA ribosyltransferase-isomerase